MSVDKYLGRRYNSKSYNCLHFTRDVWLEATGVDIKFKLYLLSTRLKFRKSEIAQFKKLECPQEPCLVLMRSNGMSPHIGVYLRGKVLHLHENWAEFQPLQIATRGFRTVEFYTC